MTKVNLGVFSEIANSKADRDLRNIDTSKTDIIIEYQEPTAENDYTWYRLYASGWVEQGGVISGSSSGWVTVNLPIIMINTNYTILATSEERNTNNTLQVSAYFNKTISSFQTANCCESFFDDEISWQVSGKADMTGHEILPAVAEHEEFEHRVILFQKPTAENNYTWYRKYADGWVEQGGVVTLSTSSTESVSTIALPIEMNDIYYTISGLPTSGVDECWFSETYNTRTTTTFQLQWDCYQNSGRLYSFSWEVKGMAAQGE